MSENTEVAKTEENKELVNASYKLEDLRDAASMVEKYARRMVGTEEAQQFSTAISIMAQKSTMFKQADPLSVVTAMMACVQLKLMPNTPEQYAYLIPYKNNRTGKVDIQFQVGYKGLIELAYRSSQIKSLNAELIFQGDDFHVDLGTERRIRHTPNFDVDRTDYKLVTHAYFVATLSNGGTVFEIMTRKELDKIQSSAKASSTDTPWNKWPEMMARKTIVKRGVKLLPSSGDDNRLAFATAFDSWAEAGKLRFDNGQVIEGEVSEGVSSADRRKRMIEAQNKAQAKLHGSNHDAKAVQTTNDETEENEED